MKEHSPTPNKLKKAWEEGKYLKIPITLKLISFLLLQLLCGLSIIFSWVNIQKLLHLLWSDPLKIRLDDLVNLLELLAFCCITVFGFVSCCMILIELFLKKYKLISNVKIFNFERYNLSLRLKQAVQEFPFSSVLSLFVFSILLASITALVFLAHAEVSSVLIQHYLAYSLLTILAFTTFSMFEISWKKHRYFESLKMDHQEVRDEVKEQERNPFVNAQQNALYESWMFDTLNERIKRTRVVLISKEQ